MTEREFQQQVTADIRRIVNGVRAETGNAAPLARVRCWVCKGDGYVDHTKFDGPCESRCCVCAGKGYTIAEAA